MAARPRPQLGADPADAVARVALARRASLLRVHGRKLPEDDLEDCFSQATMELVSRARVRERAFESDAHIANALEQKLTSRIADRRRALEGRSAKESAFRAALGANQGIEEGPPVIERVADPRPSVEDQVQARLTLAQIQEVVRDLSEDQRTVLVCQDLGMSGEEVCARFDWSAAKFRKTAQRARAKVVALVARHDAGELCVTGRPDLIAVLSHTASDAQRERAELHLSTCIGCARMVSDAAIAARRIGALLPPIPVLRDDDAPNRLVALFGHIRRLLPGGGSEHADAALAAKAGAAGAAGAASATGSTLAGGGLAGAGALKVGVAALCAAGAVGTVAVCERAGSSSNRRP